MIAYAFYSIIMIYYSLIYILVILKFRKLVNYSDRVDIVYYLLQSGITLYDCIFFCL